LTTLGEEIADIAKHRQTQPSKLCKIVRGDLDWIVMKALEKKRTSRYETANEFALDVQRYLENEMVLAGPPSIAYRARKWVKRHKVGCTIAAVLLISLVIFLAGATTQRRLEKTRLNILAERGLADARVAIAKQNYSTAQNNLTYIKAQLVAVPSVMDIFEPRMDELWVQAESKLLLQRYETLAEEARFSAQPLLGILPKYWDWSDQEFNDRLIEARNNCYQALSTINIADNPDWLNEFEKLFLEPPEVGKLKRSVSEIMFLLSNIEFQLAKFSEDREAYIEKAVDFLNQVEVLEPDMKALYEYRSNYWDELGNHEAAKHDAELAKQMLPVTWLDHWLLSLKLFDFPTHSQSVDHMEKALILKVDEYWTWYGWGLAQDRIGLQSADARKRCQWALSICINLRPNEASAWIARGFQGRIKGQLGSEMALADIKKGLELTSDNGLMGLAYYARSEIFHEMGNFDDALKALDKAIELRSDDIDLWLTRYNWNNEKKRLEDALLDLDRIVQLKPDNTEYLLARAKLGMELGLKEQAYADATRVLEIHSNPDELSEYFDRIQALEITGQWEQIIIVCLDVQTNNFKWDLWPRGTYPKLASACIKLGEDYLDSGRFDKALSSYERSVIIEAKSNIARILVVGPDIRNPEMALPYAEQAFEAEPDSGSHAQTLGIVYYRLGNYEKAIETLQRARQLHKAGDATWEGFFMAMCYWQLGNKDLARDLYYQTSEMIGDADPENYLIRQLRPYQYEAASLLGISSAPVPDPSLVYLE
jgi:tetratricopeptide (TPR) repeat protein